ncbi:MAG: dTDP-glucose 4,6-dehydratase [Bacteroidota bacterium]
MSHRTHTPRVVLVTGGAGFIGSNFLLRVVPNHPDVEFINVDALTYAGNLLNLTSVESRPNYSFVRADIADHDAIAELVEARGVTTIVHFAAESHVDRSILDPLGFVRTNVMGTANLLDIARRAWAGAEPGSRRFYHVSTDEVFGTLGEDGYFVESTPYDPRSPYSASKAASDHLVRAYHHTFGLPVVLSNCTNNYGPYQFPEKLIPLMIRNAVARRPLPVYGKGDNVRDWLHVADHCEAIETILLHGAEGETYCIGGDAERPNLDIVHLIADLVDERLAREAGTSRDLIEFVTDRPGHDFRYAMDCSYLKEQLGWAPRHTLEEGLRETVNWYIDNPDWLEAVADASYQAYYEQQYGS